MLTATKRRAGGEKTVCCTHCGRETSVAKKAMSVFCPHCKKRLILEDFRIKNYYATREFATCGDIVVEKGASVFAPILVSNLTVRGQVRGDVKARDCVRITATGRLCGDIRASRLIVAGGAVIEGICHIEPLVEDAAPPASGSNGR